MPIGPRSLVMSQQNYCKIQRLLLFVAFIQFHLLTTATDLCRWGGCIFHLLYIALTLTFYFMQMPMQ